MKKILTIHSIPQPTVSICNSDHRFPIRRIYCVGRNYREHAQEMGHDPDREPPFFFSKPADSLLDDSLVLPWPQQAQELHHEAELVVALGAGGRNIAAEDAGGLIWGYAIGCDLTLRDLQATAKKLGRPWDLAKGFDGSAVCGPLHAAQTLPDMTKGAIWLSVNDQIRQRGDLADMIWNTNEVIATLSQYVELRPGDLIYTGTPAGVGPLHPGDSCKIGIEGLGELTFQIGQRPQA